MSYLSASQLKRALAVRERIEVLEAEFNEILGSAGGAESSVAVKGKRTMSASARAKIAAAQRARWARQLGATPGEEAPAKKGRRKMKPAARAKIAAAARKRWAKAKAEGKSTLAATA